MKKFVAGLMMTIGCVTVAHAAGNPEAGQAKAAVCGGCHGADGNSAVANFPKLAGQGERYLVKQIHDIKSGARVVVEMTGLTDNLSDQDIEDIAAYFASKQMSIGAAKEDTLPAGESLFRGGNLAKGVTACAACHGPTGAGVSLAGFPKLAGQHAQYIEKQLKSFRAGERSNDGDAQMMRSIAAKLSDAEIAAVANYVTGLHK